jgi:hypothetical protein
MRNQLMPLDPLSLTCLGMATWLTDVIVARKFSEALWLQNALVCDAMRSVASAGRGD